MSLIRPSYHQGFFSRTRGGIPLNPQLWKGLVGLWAPALGVTGVSSLPDLSGFENHGAFFGSMTGADWVTNVTGASPNPMFGTYGLQFDGVDDRVISPIVLRDYDEVTINVWVYLADWTNANTQHEIFVGTSGVNFSNSATLYAVASQDRVVMIVRGGATLRVDYDYGAGITSGWHMVTGQASQVRGFSGASDAFSVAVLFDADKSSQLQQSAANLWAPTSDQTLRFGAANDSSDFGAITMGVTQVWDRILEQRELQELFDDPLGMFRLRPQLIAKAPAVAGVLRRNLTLMGAGK